MARANATRVRERGPAIRHETGVADPGRAMANVRRSLGVVACDPDHADAVEARDALAAIDGLQRLWVARDAVGLARARDGLPSAGEPGGMAHAVRAVAGLMEADALRDGARARR